MASAPASKHTRWQNGSANPETASFDPGRRSREFEIFNVAGLRLRFQIRCGLGLNQNLLFLDGHYLSFHPQFRREPVHLAVPGLLPIPCKREREPLGGDATRRPKHQGFAGRPHRNVPLPAPERHRRRAVRRRFRLRSDRRGAAMSGTYYRYLARRNGSSPQ